jgi:hypothetical protein
MRHGMVWRRRVPAACAAIVVAAYGCERPNPNKVFGDELPAFAQCPTPSTGSSHGNSPSSSATDATTSVSSGGSGVTSTGSGNGPPPVESELDLRVLDYSEALRTASILLIGDMPSVKDIDALADLPPEQQHAKYESMIDAMLNDAAYAPRFAASMIAFFKYTFKMGGSSTLFGEPNRETAPVFAAKLVVEGSDWRQIVTQDSYTCPTYEPVSGKFIGAHCTTNIVDRSNADPTKWTITAANVPNVPNGMMHAGILTNPGIQSLYYGNLGFRRNRFFHEIFLCKSANETAGGEPSAKPGGNVPCQGVQPIEGYSNKWSVGVVAGKCNGGRIDFHEWNASTVCANCHATWNHRAPLFSVFDSDGRWINPTGTYPNLTFATKTPVDGTPNSVLSDWLCVAPTTCPNLGQNFPQWKLDASVNGVVQELAPIVISGGAGVQNSTAALVALGQQIAADDEFLDCSAKRIWNYAMGRADIAEIGGRNWVSLDRKNPPPSLLTQQKLTKHLKDNGYSLKELLRFILVSDDFVRF